MYVNLLSDRFLWNRLVRARLLQWGTYIVWIGAMGLVWDAPSVHRYFAAYKAIEAMRTVAIPVTTMQSERQQMVRQANQLRTQMATIEQFSVDDKTANLVALFGSVACHPDTPIQLRDISVLHSTINVTSATPTSSIAKSTSTDSPKSKTILQITLRGVARNATDISRFIDSLQSLDVLTGVELRSARDSRIGETPVEEFELVCTCDD